jgi:hypothetical protein
VAAEGRASGRLLQRQQSGSQLVAEAAEEVSPSLPRQALADLAGPAGEVRALLQGKAGEAVVVHEGLPATAGRRERGVGGAVPFASRDQLESPAYANPERSLV